MILSLIVSNDSIMKPPYDISAVILKLLTSISEKVGEINANLMNKPSPQLRKQNRIKTIHSSLSIEGNTLTQEQVTAIIENKRIIGPKKDVLEVLNAVKVYDNLSMFNPVSSTSFLKAHKLLMEGLIDNPGNYRSQGVGIYQGSQVAHIAPPFENVPALMNEYSVFEFLPFETLISQTQNEYYEALGHSDKLGKSTPFIEYMLGVIEKSLIELLDFNNRILTDNDRLEYFISLGKKEFTRKDYMNVFKDISTATASRDLKKGVELNLFEKTGEMNKTIYKVKE